MSNFIIRIFGSTYGLNDRGETSIISSPDLTGSESTSANLNFRRLRERNLYNKVVVNEAANNDFIFSSSFNYEPDVSIFNHNYELYPPSWTQGIINNKHGFVIPILSSSHHEISQLNAYNSGSIAFETTAVPASGNVYYQKNNRFKHAIYSLTASNSLSGSSGGLIGEFDSAVGNRFSGSLLIPAVFKINIPDYGKIRDIRVWFEMVHQTSTWGSLRHLTIALRSPNVNGFISLPELNNGVVKSKTPMYDSSYLLYERADETHHFAASSSTEWHSDYNMRTIFTDSSEFLNPRDYHHSFASGTFKRDDSWTKIVRGSPNNGISSSFLGGGIYAGDKDGNSTSWFADTNVTRTAQENTGSTLSPPPGWLTGPGGTAAENEFPTTGSNYGAPTLKPRLPLLDTIVTPEYHFNTGGANDEGTLSGSIKFKGIKPRPGLRGTEIHGEWELLVATFISSFDIVTPTDSQGKASRAWFRQFRLEFIYEDNKSVTVNANKRFEKNNNVFSNRKRVASGDETFNDMYNEVFDLGFAVQTDDIIGHGFIYSDFAGDDAFFFNQEYIEYFSVDPNYSYGRTIGITSNTSSYSDFAVFSQITGSITSSVSNPWWYLNNEFGTPFIPISSASSAESSIFTIQTNNNKTIIDSILSPKNNVGKIFSINQALSNYDVTQTTKDSIILSIETESTGP